MHIHTCNALHENHKQIVLTADRKPHEISDIADRLRTRFAWGLLADIEPQGEPDANLARKCGAAPLAGRTRSVRCRSPARPGSARSPEPAPSR